MGRVFFGGGKVDMSGPVTGIQASDLAVGSSVYLVENGTPAEYLVVNKGIPSNSSLYDASCDGVWLLRKNLSEKRVLHDSYPNNAGFGNYQIKDYLNKTFFSLFDSGAQKAIKEIKLPWGEGEAVHSGSNGVLTKVFLLTSYEVGQSANNQASWCDGAKLSYFESGDATTSARNLRIATYNGTAQHWWTRNLFGANGCACVMNTGYFAWGDFGPNDANMYVRPALVVPHNAVFDEDTMILKGVA